MVCICDIQYSTVLLRNEILGRAIEIPCEAVVRPTLGSRISGARAIRYVSTYKSCAIVANNRSITNGAFIVAFISKRRIFVYRDSSREDQQVVVN
jgi:hypothetical protein